MMLLLLFVGGERACGANVRPNLMGQQKRKEREKEELGRRRGRPRRF
jgi:hypothetical protein